MRNEKKINIPRLKMPCWILPLLMAVLGETCLYLWTMDRFEPGRLAVILVFALGFGGVLALICSLFTGKKEKWIAAAMGFLLVVLYFAEYLINDAFHSFMALGTVQAGAGGVVTTYLSVVTNAIIINWWRIFILLLPVIAFAVMVTPGKVTWSARGIVAGGTLLAYLAGFGIVNAVGTDRAKMWDNYNFDSAVRAFGLNTALWLDVVSDPTIVETELDFEIEVTAPPTEETVPVQETEIPEETEEATEPPVVYAEHTMGVDFAQLAQTEKNTNISALHSYVASLEPSLENEYTGLFAGKNLIFITAEAFTAAVIDPELTPTLYRMATQGIEFTDYYQPIWGAGTTGGEYANVVGQIPVDGGCMQEATQQNLFMTIGNQLQDLGYSSAAFHNNSYKFYNRHETHTHLGYDYFMGYGNGMEQGITGSYWPQSDQEMIDYTLPMYIDQQPFSVYYMSVSGHSNYDMSNSMSAKNYDKVAHLDYSESVKCYFAANLELEYAMASLLEQLEAKGILDDTVIVIASDHYPYGLDASSTWGTKKGCLEELYGQELTDFVREQNALIIWSGSIEDRDIVVDTPVFSLDILPTLLNLFGVEFDSRLMVGRDVFSDAEPLVFWNVYGSWKTDKGSYLSSEGIFVPVEGVQVDEQYVQRMETVIRNKVKYSKSVASYNYFNYVYAAMQESSG